MFPRSKLADRATNVRIIQGINDLRDRREAKLLDHVLGGCFCFLPLEAVRFFLFFTPALFLFRRRFRSSICSLLFLFAQEALLLRELDVLVDMVVNLLQIDWPALEPVENLGAEG